MSHNGHFVIDCDISTAHCWFSSGDTVRLLCSGLSVALLWLLASAQSPCSNDHLVTNSPAQQVKAIAWSYHTQNEISNIFHHMRMQAPGFHGTVTTWY